MYGSTSRGTFEDWIDVVDAVATGAQALLDRFTTDGDPSGADRRDAAPVPPPGRAPLQATSATAAKIVADAWAAVRPPSGRATGHVAPDRLVSMERLSRRLGVTERRLYRVWPTAAAMNSALIGQMADDDKELLRTVLTALVDDPVPGAFAAGMQHVIANMPATQPQRFLAHALSWLDPEAAEALTHTLAGTWWDRSVVRAVFAVLGRAPVDDTGPGTDAAFQLLLCLGIGLQMAAQLDPELLTETTGDGTALLGSLMAEQLLAATVPVTAP